MDVWGPDDTPSLLNLNISHETWLCHIKSKDAVLDCLNDMYDKVILLKRVNDGLKAFIIQSNNGEFKSNAMLEFLHSVGGERLACCAYSPEAMAKKNVFRVYSIT